MKTVIEMARESNLYLDGENLQQPLWVISDKELERFAELIRADERDRSMRENAYVSFERERCAVLAEKEAQYSLAMAIRNRGNT